MKSTKLKRLIENEILGLKKLKEVAESPTAVRTFGPFAGSGGLGGPPTRPTGGSGPSGGGGMVVPPTDPGGLPPEDFPGMTLDTRQEDEQMINYLNNAPSCMNNDGCSANEICLNHDLYSNICVPDWSDSGVPLLMKYTPTGLRSDNMVRETNEQLLLEFPWGAFIRVLSFPKGIRKPSDIPPEDLISSVRPPSDFPNTGDPVDFIPRGRMEERFQQLAGIKSLYEQEQEEEMSDDAEKIMDHPLLDRINTKDEWIDVMNALMKHGDTISQVTDSVKKTFLQRAIANICKFASAADKNLRKMARHSMKYITQEEKERK